MRRDYYGTRSERTARLMEQMELQLEELETSVSEDDLAAERAAVRAGTAPGFIRRRPARKPFPEHLPRERVIVPAPTSCACCGSSRLSKLGEDVTETLEVIPRQWKVIQHVREKFTCRDCESISQAPAPFHVIPRGWAGPSLLAMIMFEKFGQHQPLNRQSERYAREGVPLSLSTLADQVGACVGVLSPILERIQAHVLSAERLHGDDTTVPVLAKGKTDTGRLWTYVRDDRPFGGADPPAAVFHYSRDRAGEHPERHLVGYAGILQADAYGGYGRLYKADRSPGPVLEAACWSHARRKFFVLADIEANAHRRAPGKTPSPLSPLAFEAVRRIDELFEVERAINGLAANERKAARQEQSLPVIADLEIWMRAERAKLSRHNEVAKAMDYLLKRWEAFTRFLEDGRICITNNAAERALRGIALGRKSWLFAGSDRGGHRAAAMYSLIVSCKLNNVDPQAWLADVLARIAEHPIQNLDALLPWNWKPAENVALA
jgi:transposase